MKCKAMLAYKGGTGDVESEEDGDAGEQGGAGDGEYRQRGDSVCDLLKSQRRQCQLQSIGSKFIMQKGGFCYFICFSFLCLLVGFLFL